MSDTVLSGSKSFYHDITSKILAAMNSNPGKFKMPWHSTGSSAMMPTNVFTDSIYRGINVLTLWVDALSKGFRSGYWASYQQWQHIGGQVRRGEKGSPIIFYKPVLDAVEVGTEETGERAQFVVRSSHVFNVAQVEGWSAPVLVQPTTFQRDKKVEGFVSATHARVEFGFPDACYRRDLDTIQMPSAEQFVGTETSSPKEAYYSTLLHELTHWTGAEPRLNRVFGKRFADNAYAFEELIAELGAAFMCATLGIANDPRADHAQYLSTWLKVLQQDRKAVFSAAGYAQKAVEFVARLVLEDHQDGPQ